MNKNILICIEQLSSGGVETAVLNRSIAFIEKGYNVFIACADGIYRRKAEEIGIKWINFEYKLENNLNVDCVKNMINIIKDNNIGQVHIHHFPCLIYAGLACGIVNVPYNVYIHTEVVDVYKWFIYHFNIHKELMRNLVSCAYRIIAVTYKAAENNKDFFEIEDEEKYIVERNSIDFTNYSSKSKVTDFKRFLIVSRMAEGKYTSIKNGIDLFLKYADKHKERKVVLTIVGDGAMREQIHQYVTENNKENYEVIFARRN